MGDDDGRRERTRSAWTRRMSSEEIRDADDFRTQSFLVQFYAVIPLMVVTVFLPDGPLRAIWMALVIVGYTSWGIRHVMRTSQKRRAAAEARDASEEDAASGPPAEDPRT